MPQKRSCKLLEQSMEVKNENKDDKKRDKKYLWVENKNDYYEEKFDIF
jgi:hypothetical protein